MKPAPSSRHPPRGYFAASSPDDAALRRAVDVLGPAGVLDVLAKRFAPDPALDLARDHALIFQVGMKGTPASLARARLATLGLVDKHGLRAVIAALRTYVRFWWHQAPVSERDDLGVLDDDLARADRSALERERGTGWLVAERARLLRTWTREGAIAWLRANDPNGTWTDADREDEDMDPLDLEDAIDAVMDVVRENRETPEEMSSRRRR